VSKGFIRGVLPNGTEYSIVSKELEAYVPQAVFATVSVELEGQQHPLATTITRGSVWPGNGATGETLVVAAGEWSVSLELDGAVLAALGPDRLSIEGRSMLGLPVVELSRPLRFQDQAGSRLGVDYGDFVVMTGCDGYIGSVCNFSRAVQLVPASAIGGDPNTALPGSLYLDSPAPRPPEDLYYLDPGPLSPRHSHQNHWTGSELLVWGGENSVGDQLSDGALFDPRTSVWKPLPEASLRKYPTVSLWTGTELLVVGFRQALSYRAGHGWAELAPPSLDGDDLLVGRNAVATWDGARMLIWAGGRLAAYTVESDTWQELAAPSTQDNLQFLPATGGRVVAVRFDDRQCVPLEVSVFTGSHWEELEGFDANGLFSQGCVSPSSVAIVGNRLIVWDALAVSARTMAYDLADGSRSPVGDLPLRGCDFFSEPRVVDRWLLLDSFCDGPQIALFDSHADIWHLVEAPGPLHVGPPPVWTGCEMLAWGAEGGSLDAWRWPAAAIGTRACP